MAMMHAAALGGLGKALRDKFSVITIPTLIVRICDCCLEGIELWECKGNGHQWIGNQVFRLAEEEKK
jgi:hypothetical protein